MHKPSFKKSEMSSSDVDKALQDEDELRISQSNMLEGLSEDEDEIDYFLETVADTKPRPKVESHSETFTLRKEFKLLSQRYKVTCKELNLRNNENDALRESCRRNEEMLKMQGRKIEALLKLLNEKDQTICLLSNIDQSIVKRVIEPRHDLTPELKTSKSLLLSPVSRQDKKVMLSNLSHIKSFLK